MRVLIINEVIGMTSTGKICAQIAEKYEKEGHEVKVAYGRWGKVPEKYKRMGVRIGSDTEVRISALQTRLFDNHGRTSKHATKKFIKWAEKYEPDVVWLHNLHGYYINYELLFEWIKHHPEMEIKWSLHDCWAFTGHCVHFTVAHCYKWKEGCEHCCQKRSYPASYFMDSAERNYERKRKSFTGVNNMVIITPSKWLEGLVSESFLREYRTSVENNTIDTDIFRPTKNDFKKKYKITEKKMILAVSNTWNIPSKGIDDIYQLANMLSDEYAIVIVGMDKKMIKRIPQKVVGVKKTECQEQRAVIYASLKFDGSLMEEKAYKALLSETMQKKPESEVCKDDVGWKKVFAKGGTAIPQGAKYLYEAISGKIYDGKRAGSPTIICIQKTNNQKELAEIYSAADLFINPTYEDNFPTVNLEAMACGTYVITYDSCGCRETIGEILDEDCI